MSINFSNQTPDADPTAPVRVVPESPLDSMLSTAGFPSANLLPPAIANRREVEAAKRKALLMLVAVVSLLVLLFLFTMVQQSSANAAKAQAQESVDQATVLKERYAYVPAVYQAVSQARQDLAAAMGQEVQVARLMRGLSAMQPPGLSLTTFQAAVGPPTDTAMTTQQAVIPGTGVVNFQGEAQSMDDIAAWLDRLKQNPDYASPILTDVTNTTEGLFTFTASAELTDQALSGRYVEATQ